MSKAGEMKKAIIILLAVCLWVLYLLSLEPPKKFEDLTPEERLMMDIDATAIF